MVRRVLFASGLALLAFAPILAAAAPQGTKKPKISKTAPSTSATSKPAAVSDTAAYVNGAPATHTPAKSAPAPDTAAYARDRDTVVEPAPSLRRFVVTINPLPIAAGRYGANLDVAVARHHVLTGGAYLQTFPSWMLRTIMPSGVGDSATSRFGGELGYRLYSGTEGASGFFVGPSFVAMPIVQPRVTQDLTGEVVSLMAYGAALDFGVQMITSSGFTVGGGLGVMALAYDEPSSVTPPPGVDAPSFPAPHVLPRVLFTAGWAF